MLKYIIGFSLALPTTLSAEPVYTDVQRWKFSQPAIAAAHDAVVRSLKDPSSAIYGDQFYGGFGKPKFEGIPEYFACIAVNAKNSYGGYTGMKYVLVMLSKHENQIIGTAASEDFFEEECNNLVYAWISAG